MTDPRARTGIRSRTAGIVLAAIALAIGGWMVINSPIFAVDRVVVRGGAEVSQAEVVALAEVPDGANLIRLPTDAVAARVQRHPWVADAVVTRDFPSTLVIRIRERSPAGWLAGGEEVLLVAGDGAVLERLSGKPRDVPGLGDAETGTSPGRILAPVPAGLEIAATMPPELLRQAAAIAESPEGMVVALRGGGEAWYGRDTELDGKHLAVTSILAWAQERAVEVGVIDVRVPSAPTLRPAGGRERISLPPS